MSQGDFESIKPDFIPVKDVSGSLENSPIQITSTQNFLISNEYGGYAGVQISSLNISGATLANSDNGRIYCNMVDVGGGNITLVLSRVHPQDPSYGSQFDVATATFGSAFPDSQYLVAQNGSGISGSVTLESGEPDDTMQILIPFSSTVALIADDESYLLSAMELHGVTQNNSQNGVLHWAFQDTYPRLILMNPTDSQPVAVVYFSGAEYAPFSCELTELNGSGITGTAVLEAFLQVEGRLIVKAADGIRVHGKMVLPSLAGGGTRHLVVDNDGVIGVA